MECGAGSRDGESGRAGSFERSPTSRHVASSRKRARSMLHIIPTCEIGSVSINLVLTRPLSARRRSTSRGAYILSMRLCKDSGSLSGGSGQHDARR